MMRAALGGAGVLAMIASGPSARSAPPTPACGEVLPFEMAPGTVVCDGYKCESTIVSKYGQTVPLSAPALASSRQPAPGSDARPSELAVQICPDQQWGTPGSIVQLDVQALGYKDTHVNYHVPPVAPAKCSPSQTWSRAATDAIPICVIMQRLPNLRVRLGGDDATGLVSVEVNRERVDECVIDARAHRPACDLYVPAPVNGSMVKATVKVVGTVSTELEVDVRDYYLAEVDIDAKRKPFRLGDYALVSGIAVAGLAISYGLVQAGENNGGDMGLDIAAALTSSAATAGVFLTTLGLTQTMVEPTIVYRDPSGTPITPPNAQKVDAVARAVPHPSPAGVSMAPLGLAARW
jgi:hypothetical protein